MKGGLRIIRSRWKEQEQGAGQFVWGRLEEPEGERATTREATETNALGRDSRVRKAGRLLGNKGSIGHRVA